MNPEHIDEELQALISERWPQEPRQDSNDTSNDHIGQK